MSDVSLMYVNEKLGKTQPRKLTFLLNVTGAKTNASLPPGSPLLTAYDAIAAQTTIDTHLGTSSEFVIAAFDATSLGTDSIGLLVNMGGANGQAFSVLGAELRFWNSTGATLVSVQAPKVTTLTNSSSVNECAVGSSGNVAARFVAVTGLDAATAGDVYVTIYWISK